MNVPRELMDKIVSKEGITRRAVDKRIEKRWSESGRTFDRKIVALSIAVDAGIDPRPFMSADERDELRKLQSKLDSLSIETGIEKKTVTHASKRSKKIHEFVINQNLGIVPLNLGSKKMKEGLTMAQSYYHLYIFENSVRQFIIDVMANNYGQGWWNTHVHLRSQKKAASRKEEEKKNRWHASRGAHPIFYVDIDDYKGIITKNWDVFEPYLPKVDRPIEWVLNRIEEIILSRNIVAHMNLLEADDRKRILLYLRDWLRQIA